MIVWWGAPTCFLLMFRYSFQQRWCIKTWKWKVWKGISGADQGIFDWGGPNFGAEGTVELSCGKLLLRDDNLFLNLWHGKYCFVIRGEQIIGGYPKTITFFISLELSIVAKCIVHFSKKISQLKSDIWSFQCKNFSLKQASGLIREGGPDPLNPPPRSTTAYVKHHTGYRTWLRQINGKKFLSQNVSVWKRKCIIHSA